MANTYDRLPCALDANPADLQWEVMQLRKEALEQRDEARALRRRIADLQSTRRPELEPRVAAAAVIFKALTGREQPMDRTAEDVIAELQILVDQSGSEIWQAPPRYVSIQYTVSVHALLPPYAPQDREALDAWLQHRNVRFEASRDSGLDHVWVKDDSYTGFELTPPVTR